MLATDNAGTVVWKDLTNTQIRDLRTGSIFFGVVIDGVISGGPLSDPSNRYLRNMTTAQILELDGSLIGAMNADQLNTIDHNNRPIWQEFILSPSHTNYLPSSFTWPNLTGTQVTTLFTNLVESHAVASLSPSVFAALSSTALVNGILGMLLANAKTFITGMTNSQLAQLTPNVINGLITSSSIVAAIFLNVGVTGSLNANQLQALVGGSADLSLINARVLGSTLSVSVLQGLDTAQIGRLTADQLWQILAYQRLFMVLVVVMVIGHCSSYRRYQ